MSRLFRILLVFFLVLAISAPSWAIDGSNGKRYGSKNKWYGDGLSYFDFHKIKVWIQYKRLLREYKRAGEDARQKFLQTIGLDQPDMEAEIQKIREEYEQQIAQLNSTIASYEQQLADLKASGEKALADLEASHQAEIDKLTAGFSIQAEAEYERGLEDGKATCPTTPSSTGVHPMTNSWSTGGFNPNIVDVDNSGNVYIMDSGNHTVVRYDNSGTQSGQWGSSMLEVPVDLAVDSQGSVFVLDQQSQFHLQKYSGDGVPFDMPPTIGTLVAPTGFFIASNNRIYVTDSAGGHYGSRILVFNSYGNVMITFGEVPELAGEVYHDIAVNPQDQNIYVLTGSKVAVFNQYGSYLRDWQGNFSTPSGLDIGSQGEIYVVDNVSHQVYEYDASGNLVHTFGTADLVDPGRPAVDGNGWMYVGDNNDQQIKVFQ